MSLDSTNKSDDHALVRMRPSAVEKSQPGAKRILSGMVAETLALVKKERQCSLRIVVVDDAPEMLDLMEALLGGSFKDATVLTFQDGEKAWQELSQTDPAILITDMSRPGVMSGWEMLPRLAARNVKYPIFVVTTYANEDGLENKEAIQEFHSLLRQVCPPLNITILSKPFDSQTFLKAIESGLKISHGFELKWRFGARTAALIVKLANRFASRIEISRGEEVADAKSIMGVMMVSSIDGADAGCGCRFKVSATGSDAVVAMNALTELFSCGSRIDRCIEPSCPLKPALAGYTHDTISYGCKNRHAWDVRRSDES
jgi:phosphotransferase system HPr (HPr) family protein